MSHVKMIQKGAFMRGTDKMIVKEIPVPEIGDKEVLVSLEYVGICGSDVHYYHNGCCGAYKVDLSRITCLDMNVQEPLQKSVRMLPA